jgi:hypothetical protein
MPKEVEFLKPILKYNSPKTDLTHLRMDKTKFSPAFSRLTKIKRR